MLTYRGDKFVKNKKFIINESEYKFLKKTRDNKLMFESMLDKSLMKITEEEYNKFNNIVDEVKEETIENNYKDVYGKDTDYTDMRKVVDTLNEIYYKASNDGLKPVYLKRFKDAIALISSITLELEDFYKES